jgi:hypothetical protein
MVLRAPHAKSAMAAMDGKNRRKWDRSVIEAAFSWRLQPSALADTIGAELEVERNTAGVMA